MSLEVHLGQTTGFSGGGSLGRPFASVSVVLLLLLLLRCRLLLFFCFSSFFSYLLLPLFHSLFLFEMSTTVGAFRFFVVVVIVVVGVGVGVVFILSFSNIFLSFKSYLELFVRGKFKSLTTTSMSTCNSFKNTATYCKQKTFEMLSSLGGLSVLPLFLFLARINETNPG